MKGDKRLAVRTEDHPLEYGKFSGTIPAGHYGAGEVRIFDDGWYEPVEWDDKKVSFRLHGRRYPGLEFHFVKTRTDWLAFLASAQEAPLIESPRRFQPMLAEGGWQAFDDDGWWFEPKLDGIRCLAEMTTGETKLITRTGRDVTSQYPDIHMIHELVDQVNAVLDGEIVAFDAEGKNSFEALQQRMNLANEREIKRMAKQMPVALVVFDLLWLDGRETTGLTLEERRELLELIVEQDDRLQLMTHVEGEGKAFTEAARGLGLEGVVAKKKGSKYLPGRRSDTWRKIKLTNTQDCVILGWTPGQGGRSKTFGALLVGALDGAEWKWIGQVGTGFTDKMLEIVQAQLDPLARETPPIDDPDLAAVKGATFVEPELVCEVEYLEITKGAKKMRAPSFKGLRPDKTPDECVLEPTTQETSEGLVARLHQERADLALLHPAADHLVVQAHRAERAAAPRTELEVGLERRLAPGALRHLDPAIGLQAGVGQGVDVALAVVPLDVLLLLDLERRLVHARLAGLEHVLQVVLQQRPLVEVVRAAVLAGDHHALHALGREQATHGGKVVEVRLDVRALVGSELDRLLSVGVVFHHASSSSSTKRNVLNASANAYPPPGRSAARARAPAARRRARAARRAPPAPRA